MSNTISNILFILKNINDIITLKYEKQIAKILIDKKLKLSVAESCTGGLLSSRLTDVSGSSGYIFQNFVTYANEAKETLLGVKHKTILENGVVSYDVSQEMVKGLLKKNNSDIAISTTGIAGPLGGSKEKPVGLIYITVGDKKRQKTYKFEADSNLSRRLIKYAFTNKALELLLAFLKDNYS